MVKRVVILAVPGMVICVVNSRCNAVLVKKPSIIIQLNVRVYRARYEVKASKFLQFTNTKRIVSRVKRKIINSRLRPTSFVFRSSRNCRELSTRNSRWEKLANVSKSSCKDSALERRMDYIYEHWKIETRIDVYLKMILKQWPKRWASGMVGASKDCPRENLPNLLFIAR